MNLYNMLFGQNSQSALLLAVLGLKEHDVPRFRDVSASEGKIAVYTRMGGGNRGHWDSSEDEPGPHCSCPGCRAQHVLCRHPLYLYDEDDNDDNTYATYYFRVPPEFAEDVKALRDPLQHGLRAEFGQHLLKTLNREPTEADKEAAAYDAERRELTRTAHLMANGHTFVPMDDAAMETALKLAEANGGKLRSCWGILPIRLTVETDFHPYPNARDEWLRDSLTRVKVGYDFRWTIDTDYWAHCQRRFADKYPLTMRKIARDVRQYIDRKAS